LVTCEQGYLLMWMTDRATMTFIALVAMMVALLAAMAL
jgi:hypothetical protein